MQSFEISHCSMLTITTLNIVLDPRALQDLSQGQPLAWNLPQQPGYQVLGLCAHEGWILHIHLGDSLVGLVVGFRLKWRFSYQELVCQNSQTPKINLENACYKGPTIIFFHEPCHHGERPRSFLAANSPMFRTLFLVCCWERALTNQSQLS